MAWTLQKLYPQTQSSQERGPVIAIPLISLERRRYGRLVMALPVEYRAVPALGAGAIAGRGVLRDFSLGGAYLLVDAPISLRRGQVLSLTIAAPLPHLDEPHIALLQATGEVTRIDLPGPNSLHHGLAVHFLEGPTFAAS